MPDLCGQCQEGDMIDKFEGFSSESFRFLRDLQEYNRKEWFELHKSDYQAYILKPLQALVAELGQFMLSIDPHLEVKPAVNRTISRVYRDTRFSKDKSPYKTSQWITFKRLTKDWKDFPAFFFEISPDSYRYGMGFYSASRETMDRFRRSIDSNPQAFAAAISFFTNQEVFAIEGDEYKRPLKADIPKEFEQWYHRKSFYLVCNRRIEGGCIDKRLSSELMDGFQMLAPFYCYLCSIAS